MNCVQIFDIYIWSKKDIYTLTLIYELLTITSKLNNPSLIKFVCCFINCFCIFIKPI